MEQFQAGYITFISVQGPKNCSNCSTNLRVITSADQEFECVSSCPIGYYDGNQGKKRCINVVHIHAVGYYHKSNMQVLISCSLNYVRTLNY